jgi:hypothetical protein
LCRFNTFTILFVDDVLIFCNGQKGDAYILKEILDLFRREIGMQINDHKSTISANNMNEEELECYKGHFPFNQRTLDEGLKYLGFHLKQNCYEKEDWTWIIEKLEKRLKSWSFRWLSREGRLILIKSVLEAILVYWMSLAWIPKGILEKGKTNMFQILMGQLKISFCFTLGKMGYPGIPQIARRLGLNFFFSFLQGFSSKSCMEIAYDR